MTHCGYVRSRPWWPVLAVAALAGCSRPPRDPTPRPEVDAQAVKRMRDNAASGVAVGAVAAKKGEGWGTLTGTIRLTEEPSLPPDIVATKDQDKCGQRVKNDSLTVGGGLLADA